MNFLLMFVPAKLYLLETSCDFHNINFDDIIGYLMNSKSLTDARFLKVRFLVYKC